MQNLQNILDAHPFIKLASEKDNDQILCFFEKIAISDKSADIIYERTPDYFAFLKERSEEFLVFIISINSDINGIASFNFRQAFVNQSIQTVGYIGDLRIKSNFKATRAWRNFAEDFLKNSHKLQETNHCDCFYTALMNSNKISTINFLTKGIKNIEFKAIQDYKMINFIAKTLPVFSNYKIKKVSINDEINEIIKDSQKKRQFGYNFEEPQRRLKTWNNFTKDNFLAIYDNDEIVAVASFWDPKFSKRIVRKGISPYIDFLYKALNMLPMFNLPIGESPISIKYLNQIDFKEENLTKHNKKKILKQILHYLSQHQEQNIIAYCDFENLSLHQGLSPDIYLTMDMCFYEVRHTERPSVIDSQDNVSFEMSLV